MYALLHMHVPACECVCVFVCICLYVYTFYACLLAITSSYKNSFLFLCKFFSSYTTYSTTTICYQLYQRVCVCVFFKDVLI